MLNAVTSGWTLRSVVSATSVRQQDVPALSAAQFQDKPTLNRAPIAYRTSSALRASVAMESERGATLWSLTPFARSTRISAAVPTGSPLARSTMTWCSGSTLAAIRRAWAM